MDFTIETLRKCFIRLKNNIKNWHYTLVAKRAVSDRKMPKFEPLKYIKKRNRIINANSTLLYRVRQNNRPYLKR